MRKHVIDRVLEIISQYRTRLTLRQIFYRLVAAGVIPNTVNEYKRLSKILVKARMEGVIPFEAIEDRSRRFIGGDHEYIEAKDHFQNALNYFRHCDECYNRPFWEAQPGYIEVWLEKEALSSLFHQITRKFKLVLAPCRGYSSLTYLHEAAKRLVSIKGRAVWILYFGDFDPSGLDIERDIGQRLTGLGVDANIRRVAITKDQLVKYEIPPMPAKRSDCRTAKHIARHGDIAVELDALEPTVLENLVEQAILEHLDLEILEKRNALLASERAKIKQMIAEYQKENPDSEA